MIPADDTDVPIGRPVSQVDSLFLQLGRESFKNSAPALADALNRLLPINTAVIGAGFVALKDPAYPFWWMLGATTCVLASLCSVLCGLYPRERHARLNVPAEVRAVEEGVIRWRGQCLRAAFAFLFLGLIVAGAGIAIKSPRQPNPAVSGAASADV